MGDQPIVILHINVFSWRRSQHRDSIDIDRFFAAVRSDGGRLRLRSLPILRRAKCDHRPVAVWLRSDIWTSTLSFDDTWLRGAADVVAPHERGWVRAGISRFCLQRR
jgi:hypothetical protein